MLAGSMLKEHLRRPIGPVGSNVALWLTSRKCVGEHFTSLSKAVSIESDDVSLALSRAMCQWLTKAMSKRAISACTMRRSLTDRGTQPSAADTRIYGVVAVRVPQIYRHLCKSSLRRAR